MAETIAWENVDAVVRGLLAAGEKLQAQALLGIRRVSLEYQGAVKENLLQVKNASMTGPRDPAGGGFPHRRSGNLASSITIGEPVKGLNGYTVQVGPTMVYSRILELGFANGANYPYMKPTRDQIQPRVSYLMVQALRAWKG